MRSNFFLASFALLALIAPGYTAAAPDFNRGQLLYENHCIGCHESVVHIREKRKVASIEALRAQVLHRAELQGLRWNREEIDDVVLYLDSRFYKFEKAPRGG